MDSGDMLKQLLEKFSNETAMIEEEYKLIHEQISQLEQKLAECQNKQVQVLKDREKVLAIKQRYLDGKFEPPPPAELITPDSASSPESSGPTFTKPSGAQISSVSAKRAKKDNIETSPQAAEPIDPVADLLPPAPVVPDSVPAEPAVSAAPVMEEPAAVPEVIPPPPPPPPPPPVAEAAPEPAPEPAVVQEPVTAAAEPEWDATRVVEQVNPNQAQAASADAESAKASGEGEAAPEGEETVKSINDALRSLFR